MRTAATTMPAAPAAFALALLLAGCQTTQQGADGSADAAGGDADAGDAGGGDADAGDGGDAADGPTFAFAPGVSTVAGSTRGFANGPTGSAAFNGPGGVAVDAEGRILVADTFNHRIRVIDQGQVSTLAGSGVPGLVDGALASARFNEPVDLVVDAEGRILVADRLNHALRVIDGPRVETLVGNGVPGARDGLQGTAQLDTPLGLALDAEQQLFIADSGNHKVRRLALSRVDTLAGSGVAGSRDGALGTAQFNAPCGVAVDAEGTIFVGDRDANRVRAIREGEVVTVAGDGSPGLRDGRAVASGQLFAPCGLAAAGPTLYVADSNNHAIRALEDGALETVVGNGSSGSADGLSLARLHTPLGLSLVGGAIFIADSGNHRVRVFVP